MTQEQFIWFVFGFILGLPLERKFNLMQKIKDQIKNHKKAKGAK